MQLYVTMVLVTVVMMDLWYGMVWWYDTVRWHMSTTLYNYGRGFGELRWMAKVFFMESMKAQGLKIDLLVGDVKQNNGINAVHRKSQTTTDTQGAKAPIYWTTTTIHNSATSSWHILPCKFTTTQWRLDCAPTSSELWGNLHHHQLLNPPIAPAQTSVEMDTKELLIHPQWIDIQIALLWN